MAKSSAAYVETDAKILSVRFVIALLLIAGGIAWIAFYYVSVRPDPSVFPVPEGKPKAVADLGLWNYAIGFGALLLGLAVAAHPSTPLGRGRGSCQKRPVGRDAGASSAMTNLETEDFPGGFLRPEAA